MMNDAPLVSVILPFFNQEKFIGEAIESVLSQSTADWELLLIDDGSTDSSMTIAKRFSDRDPDRIRYLEHEGHSNEGASASRNLGIRHARGQYIAFLDADDVWRPEKLEQQIAILTDNPEAALVYGRCRYWYSWSDPAEDGKTDHLQEHGGFGNAVVEPPSLFIKFLTGTAALPPPTSVIVRRSVLESTGSFEDRFRGLYDDQVFYTKILLQFPAYVSNNWWVDYRQHADSICQQAKPINGKMEYARLQYLEWANRYVLQHGPRNDSVLRAIRRELWMYRHYRHESQAPYIIQIQMVRRWIKKWLLRVEDRLLPGSLSSWLWLRRINCG